MRRFDNFDLKKEYKRSFQYLKESRGYFFGVVVFFVLFALIGFLIPYSVPQESLQPLLDEVGKWIEKIMDDLEGKGLFGVMGYIFKNNASVALVSIFAGVLFGVVPAVTLVFNGVFIGFVMSLVMGEAGVFSFWRLLPHGIFELPAIFIAFGVGIKFGTFVFHKKPLAKFREYFYDSLRVFFLIIVPLLLVAAFIEAWLIVYFG